MNGIAEIGLSYQGKEIDIPGYSRYCFNAREINLKNKHLFIFSTHEEPLIKVLLEREIKIYFEPSNDTFVVDNIELYINGVLKGRSPVPAITLHCHRGAVILSKKLTFNKENK